MKTVEYLSAVKAKLSLTSDYGLAKALKLPPQAVSHYVLGRRHPDPLVCFRIADVLGLPRDQVIADIEFERAEKAGKEDQATAWRVWIERLGGVAATLVLGTVLCAPSPADASMKTTPPGAADSVHYVKRRRKPKARREALASTLQATAQAITQALFPTINRRAAA